MQTHTHIKTPRRLLLALFACAVGFSVSADIVLTTNVQKVERFVAENGEVQTRLLEAEEVIPGDELRYIITFENNGDQAVDAKSVVITNPVPVSTSYLNGTAFGAGTDITFSVDGGGNFDSPEALRVFKEGRESTAHAEDYSAIRWTFRPELAPGQQGHVSFNVRLK